MKSLAILASLLLVAAGCNNLENNSSNSISEKTHLDSQSVFSKASSSVRLLSKNKPSKQSNVRAGQSSRLAFDGNKSTTNNMQTERTRQPYLEVDLQGEYNLSYVNLYNRNTTPNSYADRLKNYYIFVSSSPFRSNDVNQLKSDSRVSSFYQAGQAGFPSKINIGKKGRYVRVQLVGTNYLHITELEVFGSDVGSSTPTVPPVVVTDPPASNNKVTLLSRNKPSKQSNVRSGQSSRLAFDGNKSSGNNMQTERTRQPYLEVDLQGEYNLSYVNLYNRNTTPKSYAERLKNYYVFVSSSPFRSNDVNKLKSDSRVSSFYQAGQAGFPSKINIGKKGRYVRVQLTGTNYLHITELEVYGSRAGSSAPVVPPVVIADPPAPKAPTNSKATLLSRNKPTKQSSVRGGQAGRLAVDGNKSATNNMQTESDNQPWFEIDLQKSYDLSHVNIFNRNTTPNSYADRLKNYYIFVSDKSFKSSNINTLKSSSDVKNFYQTKQAGFPSKINLNTRGRYLRVQLTTRTHLHMTEIEIYGSGNGIIIADNNPAPKSPTTPKSNPTPPPTSQPPVSLNGELPMGGAFYGNYNAGILTGNSRIGYELSRRFRAQKTGDINAVRYNNRVLTDTNIKGRCLPSNPSSVWCKCKNAGLDRYTCGYTLGNSYSVGNGGRLMIEIREDDGTSRHLPKSSVLAQSAQPFVPMDHYNEGYPIIPLKNSARLQAGKIYHIVYKNLAPPTKCGLGGRSIAQAKSCPRNQGAIGLNGVYFGQMPSGKGFDPFRGKSNAVLYKDQLNGAWKTDPDNLSWYEVRYRDGSWHGDSYAAYNSIFHGAEKLIGGSSVARQKFTVKQATRTVDGLWLNFGHKAGSSPDFSSLAVKVKDSTGRVIATGSIAASRFCAGKVKGASLGHRHCREWGYTNLNKTISLLQNRTYTVEFSGSSRSQFVLSSFFPLNYGGYQSKDVNHWGSAQAEISTNSGRSWAGAAGTYYAERDYGLLFTIKGKPKALP